MPFWHRLVRNARHSEMFIGGGVSRCTVRGSCCQFVRFSLVSCDHVPESQVCSVPPSRTFRSFGRYEDSGLLASRSCLSVLWPGHFGVPVVRRFCWAGFRFGEASHPGPQTRLSDFFQAPRPPPEAKVAATPAPDAAICFFAVVNPTSVLHKAPLLGQLQADVLVLSETSAVDRTQSVTSGATRRLGYKCVWGQPVPCHYRDSCPEGTMRGLACGVALMSRRPCRRAQPAMPQEALDTCRLVDGFVRLGALEIRVIGLWFPAVAT